MSGMFSKDVAFSPNPLANPPDDNVFRLRPKLGEKAEDKPFKTNQNEMDLAEDDDECVHEDISAIARNVEESLFKKTEDFNRSSENNDECGTSGIGLSSIKASPSSKSTLKPFECDICHRSFLQRRFLLAHQYLHTQNYNVRRKLMCDYCKQGFPNPGILIYHKKKYHLREMPFPCAECDRAYETNESYMRHYHKFHSLYKCDVCDKLWGNKNLLMQHKRCHFAANSFADE